MSEIPMIVTVKEVHTHPDSFVLIAKDRDSGKPHRYSVVRVYLTGTAKHIGHELDLKLARKIAQRSSYEDGKSLFRVAERFPYEDKKR